MTELKKVKKMWNLDAATLGKLKEMEHSLAKEEAKKLENAVPDGHPLKEEIEKQKAVAGGDLSGLPAGHPLIRALNTAKEAYETRQMEEKNNVASTEPTTVELRKAKKLDEVAARRARYRKEEEENGEFAAASKTVNKGLDDVLEVVRETWQTLAGCEEVLNKTPTGKVKLIRLKRILFATERGLSETRIGRV